jgi:hypothetical protein
LGWPSKDDAFDPIRYALVNIISIRIASVHTTYNGAGETCLIIAKRFPNDRNDKKGGKIISKNKHSIKLQAM